MNSQTKALAAVAVAILHSYPEREMGILYGISLGLTLAKEYPEDAAELLTQATSILADDQPTDEATKALRQTASLMVNAL